MLNGLCPICDWAGLMSPPHVCIKNGVIYSDEHDCEPEFSILAPDHEITD